MEKTIKLGNKDYRLHASIYSIIEYKSVFGTELLKDIVKLTELKDINEVEYSTLFDTIFKVLYIFHKPFSNISYKELLMEQELSLLGNQEEMTTLFTSVVEMIKILEDGSKPVPQFK